MGKDCTSPQLGVHFISKECQQRKTVSQGHKDSSEILWGPFHITTLGPGVGTDLGSLGVKEQEAHRVFYKKINYHLWGRVSNLCPGSRSISALLSYQESPKIEMCGD